MMLEMLHTVDLAGVRSLIRLLCLCPAVVLTGCATMKVSEFRRGRPEFRPTDFFSGCTTSFGVMETVAECPNSGEDRDDWKVGRRYAPA